MNNIVILVPVYKSTLDPLEQFSLSYSLKRLTGRTIFFIASSEIDRKYYTQHYPSVPFITFEHRYFASIQGYNQLLLSAAFYDYFINYEFLLILQTDAIVLNDELSFWTAKPYDYVGAPWPDGYELFVNIGKFQGDYGKNVKVYVGNGGLSLRRIRKCIALLTEFAEVVAVFNRSGSSEDLFFSVMGALSEDFVIPNEITASRFSFELKPSYYYAVNSNQLPMGTHAWWKWEPDFWRTHLVDAPSINQ